MNIFDTIRRQVSNRRRRKREAELQLFAAWLNNYLLTNNLRIVPAQDHAIMRDVRTALANGETFEFNPLPVGDGDQCDAVNALILRRYYGLNETEILIETGHWVE
jgi:hypothetical protein